MDLYQTVEPSLMYGWIRDISKEKSKKLASGADLEATKITTALNNVIPGRNGEPIGSEFPEWIKENTVTTDTLIIGGGVGGTATAFALSQKGKKSIIAEQGESLAPKTSSSNGDSRMYRKMYSNEFFSKMQATALDRWAEVEKISGETLLHQNGLLFYGEDTGETVEGSVLGAKETMEKLALPHTFYESGDAIAEAYPALEGCKGKPYSGVCEDTAGHIRATEACNAMVKAAGNSCKVMLNSKIVSTEHNNGGVEGSSNGITAVTVDGKTISAQNAVICAGPWTNSVLQMTGLPKLNLKIWQVQWAHYEVDADVAASIPQAFHFRKEKEIDGGLYYVFPASATESMPGLSEGKSFVKVGVDFPTGGDHQSMSTFSYSGSEEVLNLMVRCKMKDVYHFCMNDIGNNPGFCFSPFNLPGRMG